MDGKKEKWGTHVGMMLAMIGTEVGLGNIWRFPYLVGRYGGGSFLIPYLILLLVVALFGMMSEWVIGRHTRKDPMGAFEGIGFPFGREIGAWGVAGPFFLYAYYVVITSWVVFFVIASVFKLYYGVDTMEFFLSFLSSPWIFVIHAGVVVITSAILAMGVKKGIESACKVMIPALFILLIMVVVRSLTLPGAVDGIEFFMKPRWEYLLDPNTWIAALGQVFFTLSLGMGAMIIYGSYLRDRWGIPRNAIAVSLGNTSSSLLAGFAIFPAAFALGMGDTVAGKSSIGLTFLVLPELFQKMPAGWLFGGLFFLLLTFGALTSAISIQEPSIAWLDEELGWHRKKSAVITGIILWFLGLPFIINGFVKGGLGDKLALLDKMDVIIGQLALPVYGMLAIIAVGWVMKGKGFSEINKNARLKLGSWGKPWLKFVVPSFVFLLFLLTFVKTLQDRITNFPKIIPDTKPLAFVPTGIDISTIVMLITMCTMIWGGFIYFTYKALLTERDKEKEKGE
ncbi:MAG: sodium-dependent transporter [Thermodesulfobacteriota bacterium]